MNRHLLAICVSAAIVSTQPAAAQTLIYCSEASPESFNPQLGLGGPTYDANAQIYNRLVELERGGSAVIPALAESWDVSEDGLTYTFHLRGEVIWQSNKLFTPSRDFDADDVIFTFARQMDKDHPFYSIGGGTYEYFDGLGMNELITRVEKGDDRTVVFHLSRPDAAFLAALSPEPMSIMSSEYADAMLAAGTPNEIDLQPIGTGPFMLENYTKDAVIRFRRFDDAWVNRSGPADRRALVETLVFAITPDASVRTQKIIAGECDISLYPNPADLDQLAADTAIKFETGNELYYGYLGYNVQKKPLDDVRVRQALNYAIDRDAILNVVFLDKTGTKADSLIPPGLWGGSKTEDFYDYDPAKARALLAEAGLANGFELDVWAMPVQRPYMPNGRRTAEMIQNDLAAIGVSVNIVTYEWGEYLARSREGEHEAVLLGWGYDYADPGQILILGWTCQAAEVGANRSRWCNPEFDALVEQAQTITDQEARTELYTQAQTIFGQDAPALLIAYPLSYAILRSEVEGFKLQIAGGQPFFGITLKK